MVAGTPWRMASSSSTTKSPVSSSTTSAWSPFGSHRGVESTRARSSWPPARCCRSGPLAQLGVPIANELHGKISIEDEAGVIPRDAPLMIWNDTVDLDALGTFPAGVHLRPRGARSILGIWTYDTRVEDPMFPPTFAHDYSEIVIRGLAAMIPGLGAHIGRGREAIVDGGYYCKTPDNRPLIGPTTIEGAYLLGALSGFGIMASQAAAEILAAHLLDNPLPDYAAAFHPARFGDPSYQRILATLDPKCGQL